MTPDLARRRALLTAGLGFALLRTRGGAAPPETEMLRRWLDNWRGVGDVVIGMNRQGLMLHLSNVDASTWRASFGREPMLSHDGFGAGPTPWRAVQVAAWEALNASLTWRKGGGE
jgi:hypothetical protein